MSSPGCPASSPDPRSAAMSRVHFTLAALCLMLPMAAAAAPAQAQAQAQAQVRAESSVAQSPKPAYLEECAACHAAFLPKMLPAASWQRLMRGLDRHFGTDAALAPALAREIETWLVANAGAAKRFAPDLAPPEDRITRARWFERQHHGIRASTWQRPLIGKPSNCTACHRTADQGVFHEHDVRIPKQ
ncbi:MAG: diheme cytochrome c [Xanthomonadales bacterium]|nr:diheme cytochrome c [Xanthomonadales bacterium]MCC6563103.1 diheme cytochrome c [Xanthomonadales bacterium]